MTVNLRVHLQKSCYIYFLFSLLYIEFNVFVFIATPTWNSI